MHVITLLDVMKNVEEFISSDLLDVGDELLFVLLSVLGVATVIVVREEKVDNLAQLEIGRSLL